MLDAVVVGAGLTGAIIARELTNAGWKVIIIEKKGNIGGICVDEIDDRTGLRYNLFGPHYFRTNSLKLWNYVNKYSKFRPFSARILTPVETFVFEGSWKNTGKVSECEKASSCKRFRFIFPKNCPVCGVIIADLNHFHDVEKGLIYCEKDFINIINNFKEYNNFDTSVLKGRRLPKLCEYSIDCQDFSLYDPKLCSYCHSDMNSHFHNIFTEKKYCYSCTHELFEKGKLINAS